MKNDHRSQVASEVNFLFINKLISLPMGGFIAQLVEHHHTGIRGGQGFESR